MYSGSTLTKYSGRVLGAHQKVDRLARRKLNTLMDSHTDFPSLKEILAFEGKNGPDAIKRKSPAQNEPWHYYSPFDKTDSELIHLISEHYQLLVRELKKDNRERAAFEAAWLAHALVDGLTPAHHYPYEEKLNELRGEDKATRTSIRGKLVIPGITKRELFNKNWKMWGPKGLFTSHGLFEMGVATIVAPLRLGDVAPSTYDVKKIKRIGLEEWFRRTAKEIAVLEMFDVYQKKGWTPKLAWQVRHTLMPALVQTVTLAWYLAIEEANEKAVL